MHIDLHQQVFMLNTANYIQTKFEFTVMSIFLTYIEGSVYNSNNCKATVDLKIAVPKKV